MRGPFAFTIALLASTASVLAASPAIDGLRPAIGVQTPAKAAVRNVAKITPASKAAVKKSAAPDGLRTSIAGEAAATLTLRQSIKTPDMPAGEPGVDPMPTGSISTSGMALRGPTSALVTGHRWSWEEEPEFRGPLIAALDRSAALRAAISDVDVSRARTFRTMAAFLPTVSGDITNVLYTSGQGDPTRDNYTTGSISVSMALFTSGQNWNNLRSAKATERAARLDARSKASSVLLETLASHVEADFARVQLAISEENLASMRRLRVSVAKRMGAGLSSNADLADIDANLAASERQVETAKGALASARDSIRLATGFESEPGRMNVERLESLFAGGKASLLANAQSQSSVIAAARERAQAAEFQKRAAYGKYLPRIDLTGSYTSVIDQNSVGSVDPNKYTVQVKLRVPLVDFSTMADVKEARAFAISTKYRAQDTSFEVEKRISADWEDFASKTRQLRSAANEVAAAKRSLLSRQKQFEAGLINADSVASQAQNAADARLMEAQIRAERQVLMARIASEAGLLNARDY